VPPERWREQRQRLEDAGVPVENIDSSLYFRDPDGARIELISDPLGEMYGNPVF
jgi:catechol 2,3-dioxygenase-like lactoylglutathione lyase family enzyme